MDEISSAIGAALLIADKIDVSKKRDLPITPTHVWYEKVADSPVIENVEINISCDNIITINYITNDTLPVQKDQKPYSIISKAAQYLNCSCYVKINGNEFCKLI